MSPLSPRSRPQPARAPTIADRLDAAVPLLDALIRDARLGHPLSAGAYHELEARADTIAETLREAFRAPRARAVNPPLMQRGNRALW